jgi:hypothetical protein
MCELTAYVPGGNPAVLAPCRSMPPLSSQTRDSRGRGMATGMEDKGPSHTEQGRLSRTDYKP